MKILVTGAAGFIGSHVAHRLLDQGHEVVCVDNLSDYYDVSLKEARLKRLLDRKGFKFEKIDIADRLKMEQHFKDHKYDTVVHLAAQAGVRYSLVNPHSYADTNIVGTLNILEGCRHRGVKHLVYASTSSVYGYNKKMPFSPKQAAVHPVSLYAATKRSTELMSHSYSAMFGLPTTALRFFTVYGPWGRPDMALFIFTKNILEGKPIEVFNNGKHRRDFTYVDDIANGVCLVATGNVAKADPHWNPMDPDFSHSQVPYRVYNIGNSKKVELVRYIELIEEYLGKKAERKLLPMQPGDIEETWADVSDLTRDYGYEPTTSVEVGVKNFVQWYREYYKV